MNDVMTQVSGIDDGAHAYKINLLGHFHCEPLI